MCKQDVQIGRAASYQQSTSTPADGQTVTALTPRPDRVGVSITAAFAQAFVGKSGVAFGIPNGTDTTALVTLSAESPSAHLSIVQYGQSLLGNLSLTNLTGNDIRIDVTDHYLTQTLESV